MSRNADQLVGFWHRSMTVTRPKPCFEQTLEVLWLRVNGSDEAGKNSPMMSIEHIEPVDQLFAICLLLAVTERNLVEGCQNLKPVSASA